jgi:hypothetical protein
MAASLIQLIGESGFELKQRKIMDSFSSFWMNEHPYLFIQKLIDIGDIGNGYSYSWKAEEFIHETRRAGLKFFIDQLRPQSDHEPENVMLQPAEHYGRAASDLEKALFITNVDTWPNNESPSTYEDTDVVQLLRWISTNTDLTATQIANEEFIDLFADHSFFEAVDSQVETYWQSVRAIREGDFIGLDLIRPEQEANTALTVAFRQAHIPSMVLETSSHGLRHWTPVKHSIVSFKSICMGKEHCTILMWNPEPGQVLKRYVRLRSLDTVTGQPWIIHHMKTSVSVRT